MSPERAPHDGRHPTDRLTATGRPPATWEAALDEMETVAARAASAVDVLGEQDAEAGVAAVVSVPGLLWAAPTDLGPIPTALQERAERLLHAQHAAAAHLAEARLTVLGHIGALDRVEASRGPSRSVYLDVTG